MKGVICEIPCTDCQTVYVGETGNTLQMRMKEDKCVVNIQDTRIAIVWTSQHGVDWEVAKISRTELHLTGVGSHHDPQTRNTSNLDEWINV